MRSVRNVIVGLAVGLLFLAPSEASAQPSPPPCSAEWNARYSPALALADLGKRVAIGREMEFSIAESERRGSAFYRSDLASFVGINTGPRDREPYFEVFRKDVTAGAFFIRAERNDLGKTYTSGVGWTEEEPLSEPTHPCSRTATATTRVIRGFRPRVQVTKDESLISFGIAQARGVLCEQTRRGSVRIVVRGPDRTRAVRLRDTCGKWTKGTGGRGWRLTKEYNYRYSSLLGSDSPATAILRFKFGTPGTRRFRVRVTFRGRTIKREVFDVRVRVCTFFGCQG